MRVKKIEAIPTRWRVESALGILFLSYEFASDLLGEESKIIAIQNKIECNDQEIHEILQGVNTASIDEMMEKINEANRIYLQRFMSLPVKELNAIPTRWYTHTPFGSIVLENGKLSDPPPNNREDKIGFLSEIRDPEIQEFLQEVNTASIDEVMEKINKANEIFLNRFVEDAQTQKEQS